MRPVRLRAFRRFWLGMMISRTGDAFTAVALSWVVLDIAGPFQLGIVLMCFGLPRIVGGPVAGRVLDQWNPRLLLLVAISFAVMSALCLSLPAFRPVRTAHPGPRAAGRNWLGLGVLFRFPAVVVLTACTVGMLCLDGIATVLYPVYCRTFLHVSAAGYGVLVSAAGLGALLGVVAGAGLSGRLPPRLRIGAVIACGAPLFGLLRFAPDLPAAVVLLALATFGWGPYFALDRTLVQRLVPDDVRSRLLGARMTISSLGFPLGSVIGGVLLGAIGVPAMILVIAGAYLALGSLPLLTSGLRGNPATGPVARTRTETGDRDRAE